MALLLRAQIGILLGCCICACTRESSTTVDVTVRDSAGVRIVENASQAWVREEAWRLSRQPSVDIGAAEGDRDYQLFRVFGAVRLADGRIVIASAGSNELLFYDPNGVFIKRIGGSGGGPGEFQSIVGFWPYAGSMFVVYDYRLRRTTVLDTAGTIVRMPRLEPTDYGGPAYPVGLFSDGSFLMLGGTNPTYDGDTRRVGVVWGSMPFYRYDPDGSLAESLGSFRGRETQYHRGTDGGMQLGTPFFGKAEFRVAAGDRLYVASSDRYEVRVYGWGGKLETIMRRAVEPVLVTETMLDRLKEARLAEARDDNVRRRMRSAFRQYSTPETLPVFGSDKTWIPFLLVSDSGDAWVRDYVFPDDTTNQWTAFDATGRLLCSLQLPARFRPLHIGHDFVLGRWWDELDVEHVQLYELIKP